jgi:hypothetical protein
MNGFSANFFTCPLEASTAARSKSHRKLKPGIPVLSRDVQRQSLNWLILGFMVLFHVGAIAAVFFFSWSALIVAVALHVIAINVGIGMGYHRLLTHRGYQVPRWVEHLLAVCATLSLEGGPLVWVTTHRVHHRQTDRPGDPHSPREGGWWSHAGWVIHGSGANAQPALLAKYAPDLIRDGFYRWLNRYHWVPLTLLGCNRCLGWSESISVATRLTLHTVPLSHKGCFGSPIPIFRLARGGLAFPLHFMPKARQFRVCSRLSPIAVL